jgi:hypothetical protein
MAKDENGFVVFEGLLLLNVENMKNLQKYIFLY